MFFIAFRCVLLELRQKVQHNKEQNFLKRFETV